MPDDFEIIAETIDQTLNGMNPARRLAIAARIIGLALKDVPVHRRMGTLVVALRQATEWMEEP